MVENVVGSIIGLQSCHGNPIMLLIVVCYDHERSYLPGPLISDLKDFLEVSRRDPNQSPPLLMK